MNHIYKSIFNKALGVFTAVPEFASAHGKGSERTVVGRVAKGTAGFAASALAISVGLALTSTSAVAGAGIYINDGADNGCIAVPDAAPPYVGLYGISNGAMYPAASILGPGQQLPPISFAGLDVMKPCLSSGANATAVEKYDSQTNRTLFYGKNAPASVNDNGAKNLTLGGRLDVNSGIIGVGDRGVNGTDATNSIRMGTGTTLDNANKKVNTIAVGVNASTPEDHGIAIGEQSAASGVLGSLAIGKNAVAAGPVSLAQGTHAYASDRSGVAIGEEAKSSGIGHVAMGFRANAQTADADKDDTPATNKASYGVTIGHFAGSEYTGTDNVSTVAIGNKAGQYNTGGDRNVQIGDYSGRYVNGSRNIAIGSSAGSGDDTTRLTVNDTTAIGGNAKALTNQSIAIGRNSQSGKADVFGGDRSLAIGDTATAMGTTSIAIGANSSTSNGHDSIALGTNASTSNQKATAIGSFSAATGRQSLVIANNYGSKGVQPISVASGDRATAIGVETTVSGNNSVAIGDTNTVASNRTYAMGNNINSAAGADDSLAFGTSVTAGARNSIAMGNSAQALAGNATAIGADAQAKGIDSIAMGLGATVEDAAGFDGIAIGTRAKAKEKGMAVGAYSQADGVESGVFANAVQGKGSTASGRRSSIIGVESTVSGNNSVAIGDTNTVASASTYVMGNNINVKAGADDALAFGTRASVGGNNAIAMGNTATASASGSVAISNQSKAKTTYSIALGQGAVAGDDSAGALNNGEAAIAIGREASANVYNGIALGKQATVKKDSSDGIAIGSETKVNAYKGTAIGAFSEANGSQSLAMGNNKQGQSSIASGERSQVYGVESTVSGNNSVAIGDTNKVASASTYVMGNNINVAAGADDSLAFGTRAAVGGANAIALGNTASAATNYSIAVGQGSSSTGDSSIAIGKKASAKADSAVAHGDQAEAIAQSSTAIGFKAKAQGYEQVSIGSNAGNSSPVDAVNYGAVFIGRHAGAGNNSATGNTDGVSIGSNAGQNAVSGIKNVAVGPATGQYVEGNQNLALSFNAGNSVKGDNNLAMMVGAGNNIEGGNNIAIGTNANSGTPTAKRVVTNSIAMGANTQATSNNTMAIGPQARALAADAVALGLGSLSNHANSVALGAGSATSAAHTGAYTLNTSYTAAGLPVAANGTVSVGSAGKERQIQNVAAGVISATSTDAINGSQLYATNNYLSNLAGGVENVLGGDAAVDNAGNLTMSNIGGTGKGNVNDAIAAANTKVAAGENITVTPTTNADGSKTYTVATKKDLVVDSVKAGDTTVNTDGVTIANGPSITKSGINANGRKVTGLVDGDINVTSTDAVNGSQLHATNTKLADVENTANTAVQEIESANPDALSVKKDGTKVTLTPNVIAGDLVDPATGAVNTPAAGDAGKLVTAGTVANALANTHFVVDTKATDGELDTASQADQKIKSGNKVTLQAGKNLKAKQTNGANGAEVEFSLKDSISLTQVTAGTGANQVVLGNDGVKVGGKTYINNDGLNANGNKITNVANGVDPTDAVNKGQLDAVKGVADSAVKSVDVANGEQNLVVDNSDPKNPKLSLKKDLTVDSVKAGDSTLNTDGLTIAGGPSVKKDGINAGNKTITGVADGNVAAGSTDAVNGGQLAEVKSKADSAVQNVVSANPTALTANKVGDTVTLTPNFIAGDLVNADGTVNTPAAADEGKLVSAKAVADALKANHFVVDTKGNTETGSEADAKVGSSNKVTFEAGKNLTAKQANTANGGATVKFSLQDDISLNSVTAGAGDNQVVLNDAGVNVGNKNYINKDGLNANGNKVANVKAGDVSATSTDAVNGAQLHNVATSVANVLGGNAAVDGNGNVTSSDIGGTGANTVDDAIKAVNATAAKHTTVVEGKNVKVTKGKNAAGGDEYTVATKDDLDVTSVTAGNTTVNTNGLTITGGPSVTRGGIDAGNRIISGVKAGDVSATSQEAVNGSQLHATNTKLDGVKAKADTAVQDVKSGDENALTAVKDPNTNIVTVTPKLSGDLVDANGNITAPTTPADKGKLVTAGTVADALANTHFVVDTKATDGELDGASQADQKIKAGNKVTLQAGKNLKAKQTNGANGAQVEFSLKDSISLKEVTAGEGANQVVLGNDGVKVGGNTYINNDGLNANNKPISNVADGVKPTDAVNKGQLDAVKGVADSAVKSVDVANGEQNLVVDNSDPKNPKLSLKKDLTVDSVKAGDSTLNTDGLTIAGGPSVKKDGINAGDKTITNVAPGAVTPTSKDAVNGGQLYNVANNVKDLIGPDATIDPATGKVTVADPVKGIGETGKGTIGEAIKSVKDKADTAVQDIKSGDEKALSVTKAGNTYTITPNLSGDLVDANGNITAPTTPADKGKLVTAGTVADALANTHFVVDTKATDGELDGASQADQKIKAGNKVTLQAGKNLKAKQTNGTDGAQVEFSLKDSISLTQVTAGTGDNQVVLGNDGVQVGGNTYINKDGLNANNKVISNVADGVNPNDAVNKGQLDAVKGVADSAVKSVDVANGEQNLVVDNSDPKNPKLSLKKDLTVDSVKAGDSTLNTDGLTIAGGPSVKKDGINAGDKKITNVAPGAVTPTSKDAVNGSQLYNVASNVKDLIGPDAKIDPATGKVAVADPTKGIGETGKGTIGDAIKHVNDAAKAAADTAKKHSSVKAGDNIVVTEGTNAAGGKEYTVSTAKDLNVDSVKAGDTTVNNDGLTIAGGPSVKKDGINAGDKNITNVADGNVAAGSKDAVNGGQLYDVAKNVADLVGPDATIDPATGKVTVADPTKGIGETGKGTIGDAIKAVNDLAKKAAAEKTSVKAKDGRSNVTVTEGTNAAGGHEYTVDVERAVTEAGSDQVTVTSKHDADSNTTTYTVDVSDKTKASLAKADSAVQGLTSKDGNLNFNKGPNGNVEVSFNDNLNVKNITTDGVKAGDTTINSNGIEIVNGPSMTKDGINAAGKAISNVANGNVAKGSKDAVNGGQLHETAQSVADVIGGGATVKDGKVVAGQNGIGNTGQNTVHGAIAAINQNTANNFNQIRGDLRKMDRDLRGGIAGALATAGLPQAFRPGKSMVAAAASTYRGQSGLAIGVSRISDNGKVILKVTGNTNSRGDFGGTIGAGYQW